MEFLVLLRGVVLKFECLALISSASLSNIRDLYTMQGQEGSGRGKLFFFMKLTMFTRKKRRNLPFQFLKKLSDCIGWPVKHSDIHHTEVKKVTLLTTVVSLLS